MKLFVIGGTGRTGSLVIDDALSHGHTVVALVRQASSLAARPGLTTVVGSALSAGDVDAALAGAGTIDAVVLTLNARRVADSPFAAVSPDSPPTMLTDGGSHAMAAMRRHGVRKLIVLSMLGTGNSWRSINLPFRLIFSYSSMRFQVADHNNLDAAVRGAARDGSIDFVLVRPCMMTDGDEAKVKVFGEDGTSIGFMPKISRKSVARFLVEAAESSRWNGAAHAISN